MDFSMKTDKGIVRDVNQDNCYVSVFNSDCCFAVVCDGMGGPNAGDVASEMAVKYVSENFSGHWNSTLGLADIKEILIESVKAANTEIHNKSKESPEFEGMGTTLVAAVCLNDDVLVVNVGDSRAYLVDDFLEQITKDHSLIQEMIDKGQIDAKSAERFPYKNYITRALGTDEVVKVDAFIVNGFADKKILLCSDGLYNFVSHEDIVKTINGHDVADACEELINKANENGGKDNITAIVLMR